MIANRPRLERLDEWRRDYRTHGFVAFRPFVGGEQASRWEAAHRPLPGRRVNVGFRADAEWSEHSFDDPAQALGGLALDTAFKALVTSVTGLGAIDDRLTQVWMNRYLPGEHVPMHCDGRGDAQLVLCLQPCPDPAGGGDLLIRQERIPLAAGDAVLFRARTVPHGTTPVLSPRLGPSGYSRVTCVVRLFGATLDTPEHACG